MSAVLHPVGPEPPSTYWLRRALVLGVLAVVVAVVIALATAGDGSRQAVPAAPSPAVSSAPVSSPMASTPGASTSAAATASPTTATPSPSRAASRSAVRSSPPPRPKPAAPAACVPAALRATLTGKGRLKPKQPATFALSVINGSGATCQVGITARNFELRIYSGRDRIWSSRDCATAVKPVTAALGSERAVEWRMTWNGRRSAPGCKNRPEIPEGGTYVATAELTGAKPVQLRMTLSG